MKSKPVQIIDGKWYNLEWNGEPHIEICCSCSHTHRVRYRIHKGQFQISYTTLWGMTKTLRRNEGIQVTKSAKTPTRHHS